MIRFTGKADKLLVKSKVMVFSYFSIVIQYQLLQLFYDKSELHNKSECKSDKSECTKI